jgi:bacterial/archaeal transporter family protein
VDKLFAVFGMLSNAGKDTIFKIAASDDGGSQTTLFYGLKAAIIALLGIGILLVQGQPLLHMPTLPWALPVGVLTMATYTFALRSMVEGDASTSVTVFRLNFVLSSVLAAIFLGEVFTARKLGGLGLSLGAILVFFSGSRLERRGAAGRDAVAPHGKSILLAVMACICSSVLNIVNKCALNAGVSILHLITYRYVVVCVMCTAWLAVARKSFVPSRKLALVSGSCAVLMLFSLFCTYTALSGSEVSVVMPITSVSFLFTALLSFIFLRERLSALKIVGIVLAVAGIVIIG